VGICPFQHTNRVAMLRLFQFGLRVWIWVFKSSWKWTYQACSYKTSHLLVGSKVWAWIDNKPYISCWYAICSKYQILTLRLETMFGQLSKWVIGNRLFFKFLMEPKWWTSQNKFYIKWQHIYKDQLNNSHFETRQGVIKKEKKEEKD
jgi:hypothetical protein